MATASSLRSRLEAQPGSNPFRRYLRLPSPIARLPKVLRLRRITWWPTPQTNEPWQGRQDTSPRFATRAIDSRSGRMARSRNTKSCLSPIRPGAVREIRVGAHEDKIRLVLAMREGTPSYRALRTRRGMDLVLSAAPSEQTVPEAPPAV